MNNSVRSSTASILLPLAIGLWIVGGVSATTAEAAARSCGNHKEMTDFLSKKYNEKRLGLGLVNTTRMMELYVSDSGTWTVLMSMANGVTCIGAVGKNWMMQKRGPIGPKV